MDSKNAFRLFMYLLENGQLNYNDNPDLYDAYSKREIRKYVDVFEDEADCEITKINNTIYLLPNIDNDFLGLNPKDVKTKFGGGTLKTEEYYLVCYIIICIMYKLYQGNESQARTIEFVPITEILEFINDRLSEVASKENIEDIEEDNAFYVSKAFNLWDGWLEVGETEKTIKCKYGFIKRTCTAILRDQKLIILDEHNNIIPTKKLDDIMLYNYLDLNRKKTIEKIFIKGEEDA